MNSKRVLFLASVPYPSGWAASARIRNLVQGFETNGWRADVCIFGRPPEEAVSNLQDRISWCFSDSYGGRRGRQYAYYLAPLALAKQVKIDPRYSDYDCVYLYARPYSVVAPLVSAFKSLGVCVIVDVNEAHSHFSGLGGCCSPNYWNSLLGYRYAIPRADIVACISQELSRYYSEKGASTFLLPSVEVYEHPVEKGESKQVTFLYSGSFYERDNPELVLDVIEGLLLRGQQLNFVVTGPYESYAGAKPYLDRIYSTDCLSQNTSLRGRVPEQEYNELRMAANFGFVLRRNHHAERSSFPTRMVEFIRDGIIPLTTSVPDVPDYLTDGVDSIFLDSSKLDVTLDRLESLLDSKARMEEMRSNAFLAGQQHFCAVQNVAKLIDYVNNIRGK